MKAFIIPMSDNGFGLYGSDGVLIQRYARARGARRGATRRGLVIA